MTSRRQCQLPDSEWSGLCLTRSGPGAAIRLDSESNLLDSELPSFVRAVSIELYGSSVVRSTTRDVGDLGSKPAFGKQWSRDDPIDFPATTTLPDGNLRYQEALDWRKWSNGGCSFLLLPRSFDRAVMVAHWYDSEPRIFFLMISWKA